MIHNCRTCQRSERGPNHRTWRTPDIPAFASAKSSWVAAYISCLPRGETALLWDTNLLRSIICKLMICGRTSRHVRNSASWVISWDTWLAQGGWLCLKPLECWLWGQTEFGIAPQYSKPVLSMRVPTPATQGANTRDLHSLLVLHGPQSYVLLHVAENYLLPWSWKVIWSVPMNIWQPVPAAPRTEKWPRNDSHG